MYLIKEVTIANLSCQSGLAPIPENKLYLIPVVIRATGGAAYPCYLSIGPQESDQGWGHILAIDATVSELSVKDYHTSLDDLEFLTRLHHTLDLIEREASLTATSCQVKIPAADTWMYVSDAKNVAEKAILELAQRLFQGT